MTTRRTLLLLGLALVASPFAISGERPARVVRVGILVARQRADPPESDYLAQFGVFLRELGYVEGRDVELVWRFAGGNYERLKELAEELARLPVDVIVTPDGTPASLAAKRATTKIPIIFANVGDPVAVGLVRSLSRPDGNVTGLGLAGNDTPAKQMEMLGTLLPGISRVAVLVNPSNPSTRLVLANLRAAAVRTKRQLIEIDARTPAELGDAFAAIRRERPGALVVTPETTMFQERVRIARECAELRLACIGAQREFAEAGGLMAYGPNRLEILRRVATYVDRIVRGAKPAELPVEMPTKIELVVNRKTARALGLEIPPELMVLADKVID